jgi:GNAT superfamily N-acetyltransferase
MAYLDPSAAARVADDAEAQAFVSMYQGAPPDLAQRLGLRVEQHAGAAALIAAQVPSALFNRVIGLGLRAPAAVEDLTTLRALYRAAAVPSWWLHWNPYAQPEGFEQTIAAQGFTQPPRRAWTKFLRDARPAPTVATELSVRLAEAAEVTVTARAIATAFEMPDFMVDWIAALARHPGWRLYCVADETRAGTQIAGGGCLFVDGTRAWFGLGAVLASHRKRGGQRALLARRVADAIELGCTELVTETGEPIGSEPNPSLANIEHSGFVRVAVRRNYACAT